MIIEPKVRGFVCITSHPTGCAAHVAEQITLAKGELTGRDGPKNVLIIGSSTGYGLSTRIAAAFGFGASTFGVFFERPPGNGRPASAGFYNSVAFEQAALREGLYARSFNGDAFASDTKAAVINQIRNDLGPIDLVIYSLASPRRVDPVTGETYKSVLKPVGELFTGKTVDTDKAIVHDVTIEPANGQEIAETVKVMGGEDWELWMDELANAGVLAPGATTVAYSYIGPELTWAIYKNGTIGRAKMDLDRAAAAITRRLEKVCGGRAYVAVNKAVVTQASSAIPVVPLYVSVLYKVMRERGTHEGCIEQMIRLLRDRLYSGEGTLPRTDPDGRIHVDDLEMDPGVQSAVAEVWPALRTDTLRELSDFDLYQAEFLKLFGFGLPGVDYSADVDIDAALLY